MIVIILLMVFMVTSTHLLLLWMLLAILFCVFLYALRRFPDFFPLRPPPTVFSRRALTPLDNPQNIPNRKHALQPCQIEENKKSLRDQRVR